MIVKIGNAFNSCEIIICEVDSIFIRTVCGESFNYPFHRPLSVSLESEVARHLKEYNMLDMGKLTSELEEKETKFIERFANHNLNDALLRGTREDVRYSLANALTSLGDIEVHNYIRECITSLTEDERRRIYSLISGTQFNYDNEVHLGVLHNMIYAVL